MMKTKHTFCELVGITEKQFFRTLVCLILCLGSGIASYEFCYWCSLQPYDSHTGPTILAMWYGLASVLTGICSVVSAIGCVVINT